MSPRKIVYLQYTNPAAYPSLEHGSRILARNGWQVLFLGTGAMGAGDLCFPPHEAIQVERFSFRPSGWKQKLHYLRYCLWVLLWVVRWKPQWIYASDLLACPPALIASIIGRACTMYHEHDGPAPQPAAMQPLQRLLRWTRRCLAQRAEACVVPNEARARALSADVSGARVLWAWNCPSRDEVAPRRAGRDREGLALYYHGSLVQPRLPLTILSALAHLPSSVTLRVVGYETASATGYADRLRQEAGRLGIANRVEVLGPMPTRGELLACADGCDVGLALIPKTSDDPNLQQMAGASNKPFDYLARGLALLVSDLPEWRSLYVEAGCGLACDPDDARSIEGALRWFLTHPAEVRAMGERGRRRILNGWNYEEQFMPVLARLTGAPARQRVGETALAGGD